MNFRSVAGSDAPVTPRSSHTGPDSSGQRNRHLERAEIHRARDMVAQPEEYSVIAFGNGRKVWGRFRGAAEIG